MKLLNFTLIKLTFCLILGIIIAHYTAVNFRLITYVAFSLFFLLGTYWFLLRRKVLKSPYFGILAYLSIISIGIFIYTAQNDNIQSKHYTHYLDCKHSTKSFLLKIEERLKPDAYNQKYIASILSYDQKNVSGKLIIHIRKDSLIKPLAIDATFFTSAKLEEIQQPLNPHQFNYKAYLELKQIYHQLHIDNTDLLNVKHNESTIYGFADKLRKHINTKLRKAGFKPNVLSIINALLLGQRQDIDRRVYNNYINAGTIHILAVSGLHIGIILLILQWLLKPLLYLKFGRVLRPLIIIIILWCFAIIAGLSPSVTRAVTMFSIVSFATHLKRPTNIYNTLVISAFIILLIKPLVLFNIGFQLSYLAVFSIVSIQPKLYNIWRPKFIITDKLWQVFTVTLAAQIGILPISLFYFHQFPGLFFISNLVIIPCLGFILGFGLLIIVLALINALHQLFVVFYSSILEGLNAFIAWIAQFESFLFRDIPFTFIQVIISYSIIIAGFQAFKVKSYKYFVLFLIGIIGFQSVSIYKKHILKNEAFIVFNKSKHTLIGQKKNNTLLLHHNLDTTQLVADKTIRNYSVGEGIDSITTDSLQALYQYKNKSILVIDSMGIYKGLSFKPSYIVLRNSPKLNLTRVIDSLKPQYIIADASNYKSYAVRWRATCKAKKIPFHQTNKKGAFIMD